MLLGLIRCRFRRRLILLRHHHRHHHPLLQGHMHLGSQSVASIES